MRQMRQITRHSPQISQVQMNKNNPTTIPFLVNERKTTSLRSEDWEQGRTIRLEPRNYGAAEPLARRQIKSTCVSSHSRSSGRPAISFRK